MKLSFAGATEMPRNIIAHELHECNEGTGGAGVLQNAPTQHLTPKSINASVFVTTTGTTWDNLKLSFAGATEMPRNIFAHELLEIFFLPTNCTN